RFRRVILRPLRADCCSTSAQPATSLLRDRHLTDWPEIQNNRGRFAPRTAADWRFPQSGENTVPPAGLRARRTLRSFDPPRRAAESLCPGPVRAARSPAYSAELRRVFPPFCAAQQRVRSRAARWPSRPPLRNWLAESHLCSPEIGRAGSPPCRILLLCNLRSMARGTFSFPSRCSRET